MNENSKRRNSSWSIVILIILGFVYYHYRADVILAYKNGKELLFPTAPCTVPIKYSLGAFDNNFGITKTQFQETIQSAADIWNSALTNTMRTGDLLQYDPKGDLKINLVYDYRQQATEKLNEIGTDIGGDKSAYNILKLKYDSLNRELNSAKMTMNSLTVEYNSRKASYDSSIAYWNSKGGAPESTFRSLENERLALNTLVQNINAKQKTLNELVATINSTVIALNKLVSELNIKVGKYNTVGATTGEQFNEGEYIEDRDGKRIQIYQFKDMNQLKRVLEHELGHALGLDHVNNPDAIMYYLNEGTNENLTYDDITELQNTCKPKK